jgi:hypothetical protein
VAEGFLRHAALLAGTSAAAAAAGVQQPPFHRYCFMITAQAQAVAVNLRSKEKAQQVHRTTDSTEHSKTTCSY